MRLGWAFVFNRKIRFFSKKDANVTVQLCEEKSPSKTWTSRLFGFGRKVEKWYLKTDVFHFFFRTLIFVIPQKNRFPQAKPCLGCNGLRMAKVGLIEGRKIWMILEAPEKISKRTTWDPETSFLMCFSKRSSWMKFYSSYRGIPNQSCFFQCCHVDDFECTPPETLPVCNSTHVGIAGFTVRTSVAILIVPSATDNSKYHWFFGRRSTHLQLRMKVPQMW